MDNHTQVSLSHGRSAVRLIRCGAIGATVLAVLAGCAVATGGTSAKDVVAEKAQQRWDLLVKNDFAGAYRYMSPAGKQLVTEQAYAGGFKRNFWSSAKVDDVQCPTQDSCEVDVTVEYRHWGLKMKSPVHEKWVREQSNWWFVFER